MHDPDDYLLRDVLRWTKRQEDVIAWQMERASDAFIDPPRHWQEDSR
jgi:hypothetical protein